MITRSQTKQLVVAERAGRSGIGTARRLTRLAALASQGVTPKVERKDCMENRLRLPDLPASTAHAETGHWAAVDAGCDIGVVHARVAVIAYAAVVVASVVPAIPVVVAAVRVLVVVAVVRIAIRVLVAIVRAIVSVVRNANSSSITADLILNSAVLSLSDTASGHKSKAKYRED